VYICENSAAQIEISPCEKQCQSRFSKLSDAKYSVVYSTMLFFSIKIFAIPTETGKSFFQKRKVKNSRYSHRSTLLLSWIKNLQSAIN